jgi:hypothetical protein
MYEPDDQKYLISFSNADFNVRTGRRIRISDRGTCRTLSIIPIPITERKEIDQNVENFFQSFMIKDGILKKREYNNFRRAIGESVLGNISGKNTRFVVQGEPNTGKSTFSKMIHHFNVLDYNIRSLRFTRSRQVIHSKFKKLENKTPNFSKLWIFVDGFSDIIPKNCTFFTFENSDISSCEIGISYMSDLSWWLIECAEMYLEKEFRDNHKNKFTCVMNQLEDLPCVGINFFQPIFEEFGESECIRKEAREKYNMYSRI